MENPAWPFGDLRHGAYGAILADPPWRFATWSKTRQTRAAERHYRILTLAEICALPVAQIAAPDCALFLWALNPMLPHAFAVINAWGFTFKTVAFTWAKRTKRDAAWHMGLGYWTRQNTEQCLIATRGNPKRLSRAVRQLVVSPLREHSRKPDSIHDGISDLVSGPYAELFARTARPGWDAWGNETNKFTAPAS